jgi:hypothetical protein
MDMQVVPFTTDPRFVRRAREQETLDAMIEMFCRYHHFSVHNCRECGELSAYAQRRLERCIFGDAKPTCANCTVHCYNDEMRGRMRRVMRWAGPRMLLKHPILALRHKLDGRRPAPLLPEKKPPAAT